MKSLVVLNGCTSCMFYGRAEFGADFLISKASLFVSFFFLPRTLDRPVFVGGVELNHLIYLMLLTSSNIKMSFFCT